MSTEVSQQQVTSPLVGMQIITATGELFNHVEKNGPMWYSDGDREVRVIVRFTQPFQRPPHIIIGITGMDSSKGQNLRFSLNADNISTQKFELVFKTWADTKIARANVNWTAIGQAMPVAAIRR